MAATSTSLSWARLTLTLTLTLTRYNFIVAAPCLLILLLYTVPTIVSLDDVDYAMGTSLGTSDLVGVASNFSLAAGWHSEPTFGSILPSDMASLISHASLFCSVHAVYNDILVLVIGSWVGIEPTLATALVVAMWMLLYQRQRSL